MGHSVCLFSSKAYNKEKSCAGGLPGSNKINDCTLTIIFFAFVFKLDFMKVRKLYTKHGMTVKG